MAMKPTDPQAIMQLSDDELRTRLLWSLREKYVAIPDQTRRLLADMMIQDRDQAECIQVIVEVL